MCGAVRAAPLRVQPQSPARPVARLAGAVRKKGRGGGAASKQAAARGRGRGGVSRPAGVQDVRSFFS
eukprot:3318270-Prymnesium_polylepis.1